jgi:hypothetical protein
MQKLHSTKLCMLMASFWLPTSNAAHFHILRVFHQVKQWIGEADNMETKDWGWSIEHNMCMPIRSSDAINYRGITVLPVISKIVEAVIRDRIQPLIHNMQNPTQRGFTKGSSPCKTNCDSKQTSACPGFHLSLM